MHVTCSFFLLLSVLLLFPSTEMRRAGRGRGLKGTRQGLTRDRVRGGGRHGRSGPSRLVGTDCSESLESRDVLVDCQDRRLTSIPTKTWTQTPKHLLLARNRIKVLRDGAFFGFESLKSLDLQQNQISVVEEGAFQGLTRLTTLLLQHNRLGALSEEALIPMPNLRYLRLYENPWNCVCSLESLIRTLQVPSNRNQGIHARCAEPIRLKGSKLKQVDPDLLCQESDPTSDQQGDQMDPSDSPQPIPIRTKPDATTSCHTYLFPQPRLDCSRKGLTEVPTGIPDDIVHMDLSHNSIRHIRAREFQEAGSLRTLNLSNNNLEQIDKASLSGLLHLRELDLSDNSLHFVQYGVLEDLYFLSQLKLGGNPWHPLHGVLATSAPGGEARRPAVSLPSRIHRRERGGIRAFLQQRMPQGQTARPDGSRSDGPRALEHASGTAGRAGGGAGAKPLESTAEIPDHQAVLTGLNV
ncbi:leucine-rich repeat-containing protein 17-like isoform 1-T1 [Polymixia lowei]